MPNSLSAPHENKCELFGMFGFFVQLFLGIISFGSLICTIINSLIFLYKIISKTAFGTPEKIHQNLDVSKQGLSALFMHFMNLFIAVLISKQNDDDACVWYLISNLLDTSLGVVINWIFVRLLEIFARKNKIETLVSGCYYSLDTTTFEDYNISYYIWAVQASIWCVICFLMKIIIYLVMLNWNQKLEKLGVYLLENIAAYPKLELVVVMIVVPLIMNCIQFWIVDNILKESDESRIERLSRGKEPLAQVGYHDFIDKLNKDTETNHQNQKANNKNNKKINNNSINH